MSHIIALPLSSAEGNEIKINADDSVLHFTFSGDLHADMAANKKTVKLITVTHNNTPFETYISLMQPEVNLGTINQGEHRPFTIKIQSVLQGGKGGDASSSTGEIIVQ